MFHDDSTKNVRLNICTMPSNVYGVEMNCSELRTVTYLENFVLRKMGSNFWDRPQPMSKYTFDGNLIGTLYVWHSVRVCIGVTFSRIRGVPNLKNLAVGEMRDIYKMKCRPNL